MAGNIDDETSYDIFEWFPILVCQNIFKHLDGKTVIQASAVSKEWNKLCTESQQVEKLKLVFKREYNQREIDEEKTLRKIREAFNVLQGSKRKYKNIEFRGISSAAAGLFLPFLADRAGSWKFVEFHHCTMDQPMWLEMMQIIEPSVQELPFAGFQLFEQINEDFNWNFPCLKSLEVLFRKGNMLQHFLHCTSLVKFHWPTWGDDIIEDVRALLRNNHNLEDLALGPDTTLLNHPSEFSFKLKKFRIRSFRGGNVQSFLENQAQTLETLEIDRELELSQATLELILSMPRLSSLKISIENIEEAMANWNQEFPVNTTIAALKLGYLSLELDLIEGLPAPFETFIRALQNLKHFKCYEINDETLLFLARAAPALESLETNLFDVTRFPDGNIFPNITKFEAENFRQDLQESTGVGNFSALVKAEMRKHFEYAEIDFE